MAIRRKKSDSLKWERDFQRDAPYTMRQHQPVEAQHGNDLDEMRFQQWAAQRNPKRSWPEHLAWVKGLNKGRPQERMMTADDADRMYHQGQKHYDPDYEIPEQYLTAEQYLQKNMPRDNIYDPITQTYGLLPPISQQGLTSQYNAPPNIQGSMNPAAMLAYYRKMIQQMFPQPQSSLMNPQQPGLSPVLQPSPGYLTYNPMMGV